MNDISRNGKSYVLVTAAYNEEKYLPATIASIVAQELQPRKWIIVSDGSTDRTDEIVLEQAARFPFIQLWRITEEHARDFTAQVNAINTGFDQLKEIDYEFIGNVDADVSFEPDYFRRLLGEFEQDSTLGLAGGFIHEAQNGVFSPRTANRERSVPHAVQTFRRECFEEVGRYLPLKYGGPDWHAEVMARMRGWRVQSIRELKVLHHRPTGTAGNVVRYKYRQGKLDYSFGSHPLFEVIKCLRRFPERPFAVGGAARLIGFVGSYLSNDPRLVSEEFVAFLRNEQKQRLLAAFDPGNEPNESVRCSKEVTSTVQPNA